MANIAGKPTTTIITRHLNQHNMRVQPTIGAVVFMTLNAMVIVGTFVPNGIYIDRVRVEAVSLIRPKVNLKMNCNTKIQS